MNRLLAVTTCLSLFAVTSGIRAADGQPDLNTDAVAEAPASVSVAAPASAVKPALAAQVQSAVVTREVAETKAASEPASSESAPAPTDLSGWWSGTWLSHHNGHNGPIQGYFTKINDDNYCVHFQGRFWELFPFEYDVVLTVVARGDGSVTMSGSNDLGFLFGTFTYTATVTDKCFVASYCSKDDRGIFSMARCR